MDISFKKIVLAGIGSMAYSFEKSSKLIDSLIKKGELTVEQGKELNEELKRKKVQEQETENASGGITPDDLKKMLLDLNFATKDDIRNLEERIKNIEDR